MIPWGIYTGLAINFDDFSAPHVRTIWGRCSKFLSNPADPDGPSIPINKEWSIRVSFLWCRCHLIIDKDLFNVR